MNEQWEIDRDPWWNFDREEIRFSVANDNEQYVCAISQIALTDYFKTEDTQEAAFALFEENEGAIIELAIELIEQDVQREADGIYFINSELCNERWP